MALLSVGWELLLSNLQAPTQISIRGSLSLLKQSVVLQRLGMGWGPQELFSTMLLTFLIAVTTYLTRSNLRDGSQFKGYSPPHQDGKEARQKTACSHLNRQGNIQTGMGFVLFPLLNQDPRPHSWWVSYTITLTLTTAIGEPRCVLSIS